MSAFLKKALAALKAYFVMNPGAVTSVAALLVVVLASVGLHVSKGALIAILSALLPLVIGSHVAARKLREAPKA